MAPKNGKKQKAKASKGKRATGKEAAAKKNGGKPKVAKARKIGDIVKEGLMSKPPMGYEEILSNVLEHHPESKFNKKHFAWYRHQMGIKKA